MIGAKYGTEAADSCTSSEENIERRLHMSQMGNWVLYVLQDPNVSIVAVFVLAFALGWWMRGRGL